MADRRPRFSLADSGVAQNLVCVRSDGFDETKPNHRGICWGFFFMMRDFSVANLSPNPSPFRGGALENKEARGGNHQSKVEKQTHLMPDFHGFFFSVPLPCLSSRARPPSRGTSAKRFSGSDAENNEARIDRRLSKMKKQTHLMPDLQGFSFLVPFHFRGRG
jgi:hypothetical protein